MPPAKLRLDQAIGRAYRDLADDRCAAVRSKISSAARAVRPVCSRERFGTTRSIIRWPRCGTSRGSRARFVRPLRDWHGERRSIYGDVSSLARHLLCRYDVPRFLSLVWFGDGSRRAVEKREWYVAHGNGQSVRSLDLPVRMTRKMERYFLSSPDHLSFESAVRRAELLALGARDDLIEAVLATHLGRDLAHGTFWRTLLAFLVRFRDELPARGRGPRATALRRLVRILVLARNGAHLVAPPAGRLGPCARRRHHRGRAGRRDHRAGARALQSPAVEEDERHDPRVGTARRPAHRGGRLLKSRVPTSEGPRRRRCSRRGRLRRPAFQCDDRRADGAGKLPDLRYLAEVSFYSGTQVQS